MHAQSAFLHADLPKFRVEPKKIAPPSQYQCDRGCRI